jgi:hypothetical protein
MRSLSLLIDPRDPLKATANAERSPANIMDDYDLSATLYARAQAQLPIDLGGCAITSEEMSSEVVNLDEIQYYVCMYVCCMNVCLTLYISQLRSLNCGVDP